MVLVNGTPAIIDLKDQCSIVVGPLYNFISYKGQMLWTTISDTLDDYYIYLYDGPNYKSGGDPYVIICVDEFGDHFHYGRWWKLKNAMAWIEDPTLPERD